MYGERICVCSLAVINWRAREKIRSKYTRDFVFRKRILFFLQTCIYYTASAVVFVNVSVLNLCLFALKRIEREIKPGSPSDTMTMRKFNLNNHSKKAIRLIFKNYFFSTACSSIYSIESTNNKQQKFRVHVDVTNNIRFRKRFQL